MKIHTKAGEVINVENIMLEVEDISGKPKFYSIWMSLGEIRVKSQQTGPFYWKPVDKDEVAVMSDHED